MKKDFPSAARRPRKNPGRPRGEPTAASPRETLLDAAAGLFAERGLAATSLARVAAEAGLTSAMVHYYFHTKDQLIEAVVSERLAPFLARVLGDRDFDAEDPVAYLAAVVQRLARATEEHPWLPALWLREIGSAGGGLRERFFQMLPLDFLSRLADSYARGQAEGRFPKDVEPLLLMFTTISNLLLPLVIRDFLERLPDIGPLTPDRLAAHARAVLAHGFYGAVPAGSPPADE